MPTTSSFVVFSLREATGGKAYCVTNVANQQFFGDNPQDEIVCDALSGEAPVRALWQRQPGRKGPRLARGVAGARPAVRTVKKGTATLWRRSGPPRHNRDSSGTIGDNG
jgi:hypothetical protein